MTEGEARGFFSPSVPLSASNVHSLGCVCVKESPWSLCPSHRPRWAHWESMKQSCLAGLKPSAHSYALNSANMQNLCYYHTDMKVTRKLFMGGQRARAVTLLQLFLHGLWSSLSLNRVHYSSPGFAKNGLFSQWPGVTYPTTACPTPPHLPPRTNSHSSRPPVTEIQEPLANLFTPAGSKGVPEHDGLVKRPRALLPSNTVNTATLAFCFQFEYNASWGSTVGEYTYIKVVSTSLQLEQTELSPNFQLLSQDDLQVVLQRPASNFHLYFF